jgi:hypothetical protein
MPCRWCDTIVGHGILQRKYRGREVPVANAPSSTPAPWTLAGQIARLSAGEFSAAVNVDRPGLGIHDVAWAGRQIEAVQHWLALAESGPSPDDQSRAIEDCYVRGCDLVAVYAETKNHPLRYVVYWRALEEKALCGAAAGLDVVVSVQTSVLDVTPKAWLSSRCDASDVWRAGAESSAWSVLASNDGDGCDHAYLVTLAGGTWCAAEMIHSQDRIASTARRIDTKAIETRHQVLGLRLEKGVLLRARMRVLLTAPDDAREVVAACREEFERAELPLTT